MSPAAHSKPGASCCTCCVSPVSAGAQDGLEIRARSPHEAAGRNAGIGSAKKHPAIRYVAWRATKERSTRVRSQAECDAHRATSFMTLILDVAVVNERRGFATAELVLADEEMYPNAQFLMLNYFDPAFVCR